MDVERGAEPVALRRIVRGWAVVVALAATGCVTGPSMVSCPRGQQSHDGQCVPTSTLVFERCMESFRKSRVEREHGMGTKVTARIQGQGGSLQHERTDSEQAEYDGLPPELMGEAIGECRRQEEQQRGLELERAWAAADEAREEARAARRLRDEAEGELRRAQEQVEHDGDANEQLRTDLEQTRQALSEAEAALEQQRALLVEQHPCTAEAWDLCGEQALVAKRQGDYVRAHALYREACEGGSAEACGNWGVMFEHGLGVLVDPDESRRLYERGCDGGSMHACVNLGFSYEQGRGTPRDLDRAAALHRRACDAGEQRGCGRLGRLVSTGAIDDATLPPALELLGGACDGDYPRACLWAGERELQGRDGERQPGRAARRFRRACEHDVPEACVTLGRMLELGDGMPADPAEAIELYQRACQADEPRGCAAVERMSRGSERERNVERSAAMATY